VALGIRGFVCGGLHQLYTDKQLGLQNDDCRLVLSSAAIALPLSPKPLSNSTVIVVITSSHSATDREAS
jgi:hypothetical protein